MNDNLIEFALFKLSNHISKSDLEKIQLFSTQFYTKLVSLPNNWTQEFFQLSEAARNHSNVRRWTKKVNIFDTKIHIYPINEIEYHWYLIVVIFPDASTETKPFLVILDSCLEKDNSYEPVQQIKNYLIEEHKSKAIKSMSRKYIEEMRTVFPNVPQQSDASSCGLYLIYFVEQIFRRVKSGKLSSMFDDASDWFKDKHVLDTMRFDIASVIKETATSQGLDHIKLPNLQYLSTAIEDRALKWGKSKHANIFSERNEAAVQQETKELEYDAVEKKKGKVSYKTYIDQIHENQQDYTLLWSYECSSK